MALCLLACAIVAAVSGDVARSARERESSLRAQALAHALAARVSRALALGIPLEGLQGVEAAFARRLRDAQDVRRIVLVDGRGAVMRQAGVSLDAAEARTMLSARAEVGEVDDAGRARTSAAVIVYGLRAGADPFAWEIGVLAAAVAAMGAWAVSALWLRKFLRGPAARLQAIEQACRLAADGDWTRVPDAGPSSCNGWLHAHVARVRDLVERHVRVDRLANSLIGTEPDAAERMRLADLLLQTRGQDRFPAKAPDVESIPRAGRGTAWARALSLRTRLTAIVATFVLALGGIAMLALTFVQRHHAAEREQALLAQQALGWSEAGQSTLEGLGRDTAALAAQPGLVAALSAQDRARLAELSEPAVRAVAGRRVDFYDARGRLAYTSSSDLEQGTLLEPGWRRPPPTGSAGIAGLTLVPRREMFWFTSRPVRDAAGRSVGMVALADPVAPVLASLSRSMKAEVILASSRGRVMQGGVGPGHAPLPLTFDAVRTQAQRVAVIRRPQGTAQDITQEVRQDVTQNITQDITPGVAHGGLPDDTSGERELLVTSQPITRPDGRTIGQLVALRDETEPLRADRRLAGGVTGAVLMLAAGIAWGLSHYLRRAFEPLRSSLDVLGALAEGRGADCRLSPWDEHRADEAGAIARRVSALRDKVLELALLREERTRSGEQQERLIRRELRRLAETLDADARGDVIADLAVDGAQGHPLGRLSSTLGRMSQRISTQHARLVDVLKELQASLATRALFESLQRELQIARDLQQAVLPRVAPRSASVQVAALMVPAKEIGGDFYDYFVQERNGVPHLVTLVADVSGKGIPAALHMAITRTLLKGHARLLGSPAQILAAVNDELAEDNEQMMFVTIFLAVIDLETGAMTYVNAGHGPPLLRCGRTVRRLQGPPNMALGVEPGLSFAEGHAVLQPGQQVFLFTDGVTEATGPDDVLFGEGALCGALRGAGEDVQSVVHGVLDAVHRFAGDVPQADDITCVAVEYRGAA